MKVFQRPHKERKDRLQRLVDHTEFGDCWIWNGILTPKGYGKLKVDRRWKFAYRYSYELFKGDVPEGLVLDHLCRQPACVNPDHLEPVTNRENILRGVGITAQMANRQFCKRGHNVKESIKVIGGMRQCAPCREIRNA